MLDNSQFKILVVDDEMFNIEVVLGFLEEKNYNLSFNTNPKKALLRIFEEDFDLILLDINMPQINGLEMCEKIKRNPQKKDIPIIFLSALNDTQTITNAFDAGAVDYITKPFNGLELIARVQTHIELRKYIRELQIKQEKLAQIVATDIQTGLPNRLRFLTIIKKETQLIKSNPSRLTLAYIKIDNLSKINELHGYKNGDKVILKITKIIHNSLRENYTLARFFALEFVLLMPDTSVEVAKILLKKILTTIRADKTLTIQMTCSIGVDEYKYKEEYDKFILRTEALMQDISRDGGNMIAFAPST